MVRVSVDADVTTARPARPGGADISAGALAELFAAHSMRVHGFLRDQGMVTGVGRRLANEVCHRARVSPFATTRKLGADGAATSSTPSGPVSPRASTSNAPATT